jgi:tetratricopeptide (TPR) repeat protein
LISPNREAFATMPNAPVHAAMRPARFIASALCAALAALFAGCASPANVDFVGDLQDHSSSGTIVADVPRIRVDRGNYGAQALTTLLVFWGRKAEAQSVKEMVARVEGGKEFEERLMVVAGQHDLWAYSWYGTFAALKERLSAGIPTIVQLQHSAIEAGSRRFAVVIGFDDETRRVLCEEGGVEPTVYSYKDFAELWKPVRFWTMIVCPPGRPTWELSAAELVTRARYFENLGKPQQALADYNAAMVDQPLNSRICVNTANLYRKLGEPDKAEGLYRRAIDIDPGDGQALNNLAFLYAERGRNLDEASELAKRALLIEPTNPLTLDTLGYVLLLQGRYADAASYLEQAQGRARMLPPARREELAIHLMRAYVGMGRTDRVSAMLSDLRTANPQFKVPADLAAWAPSGKPEP